MLKPDFGWPRVWYITVVEGYVAWFLYRLPLQIAFPDFHATYLLPGSGHLAAIGLLLWCFFGAYKTAMMIAWNSTSTYSTSTYSTSIKTQITTILMVPLAVFIPFKREWYFLPERSHVSKEDDRQE